VQHAPIGPVAAVGTLVGGELVVVGYGGLFIGFRQFEALCKVSTSEAKA
jgi:hypothetical protein